MKIRLVIEEFFKDEILLNEEIPSIPFFRENQRIVVKQVVYKIHEVSVHINTEEYITYLKVVNR